jgi:adenylate kinase family enzyme
VARRLAEYDERTKPLIDYYHARSRFYTVDGYRPVDVVFAELVGLLEELR